jgi:hypothetical protein
MPFNAGLFQGRRPVAQRRLRRIIPMQAQPLLFCDRDFMATLSRDIEAMTLPRKGRVMIECRYAAAESDFKITRKTELQCITIHKIGAILNMRETFSVACR